MKYSHFDEKDRAIIAEFVGTFILTFCVLLSIHNPLFPVPTPVVAALTLALAVYVLGHAGNAFFNPAVTIAALSLKKINVVKASAYLIAQFAGAALAMYAAQYFLPELKSMVLNNSFKIGMAEAAGSVIFGFGVAAVLMGKVVKDFEGAVVGVSLLLGILVASVLSNGVLNPAVAFGINSLSISYVWGPILGVTVGMWIMNGISKKEK